VNAKDIRKYALISQLVNSKPQSVELPAQIAELAQIDFSTAFEVWEFVLHFSGKDLANLSTAQNIETKVFENFVAQSETKTRQLLASSDPLIRLIYGACATSVTGVNLTTLVSFILSAKLDVADVALAGVRSNPTGDFGERMRIIVDTVFKTYCESKGVKKCELTRKQSALLLEYISKIKGPIKMLLTQRIKEL
jgi:hypothetical protein